MKKILFLGELISGGAEHQMVVLARLMKKNGYDVTYLCSSGADFYQGYLEEAGIPIIRIKHSHLSSALKLNTLQIAIHLRKILKQGRYDTVVSFLGLWNFLNCITSRCRATRHRAITGIRNMTFQTSREKFYNFFERFSDVIVSNSEAAKAVFASSFPVHFDKLTTIYNIVDLPKISSDYICRRDERVHIIVPASYYPVKNPMGLLHALSLLSEEDRKKICIEWYGNIKNGKDLYEKMVAYIETNELSHTIVLHDVTTDIANRINEADMVGLFSISEGLPNAICEGMMLGKPVVMTRVSDYHTLVDESNGFLCDADNPQSICDVLSTVSRMENEKLLNMGDNSRNKAKNLFSEENVLKKWCEIV